MKIILTDFHRERTFSMISIFAPIGEWPLFGLSLRELLEQRFDVYYELGDELFQKIISKRWGVRASPKVRGERIYLNQNIYGSPIKILNALESLPHLCNGNLCKVILGGDLLAVYSGYEINLDDLLDGRLDIPAIELEPSNIQLFRHPWELLKAFINNPMPNLGDLLELIDGVDMEKNIYFRGNRQSIEDKYLYIDVGNGPIFIDEDVVIEGHSFLKGPLVIRSNSLITSAKIYGSIIGGTCKIGGEIGDSIILGYSNAVHHSYIGHSLIGYWVNVGAGTVFSDLKNTYGPVRIKLDGEIIEVDLIKFGSIVGDHVKISINSSIYAGRMIGISSHLYGVVKHSIPPFRIYNLDGVGDMKLMDLDKVIEIARRMYKRRGIHMFKEEEELFRRRYESFLSAI